MSTFTPNDNYPPATLEQPHETDELNWNTPGQLQDVPLDTSFPNFFFSPTAEATGILHNPSNNWSNPGFVPTTDAPDDLAPQVLLQVPQELAPQGFSGLVRTSSMVSRDKRSQVLSNTDFITPAVDTADSPLFAVPSAPQVPAPTSLDLEQLLAYFPTPESMNSSAIATPGMAAGNLDNYLVDPALLGGYPDLAPQAGADWYQQVPLLTEPPMDQPQLAQNAFIPVPSQSQLVQNAGPFPSDFQFTFEAPVPPPVMTMYEAFLDTPASVQQANSVALAGTYSAPALPLAVTRLAHSESMDRPPSRQSHKRSLKRGLSTTSNSSTNKRRRAATRGDHPSIPQGNWRKELRILNLNAYGKYFTLSPLFEKNSLSGAGAAAKDYACLYIDPFNGMQCWRKMNTTQSQEWLSQMDGRTSKGFFPRHTAEMLRHLAMHRKEDAHAARSMPKAALLATVWQDQIIDEQIIKDRDDPGNQVWYLDEKRKSRNELDEELAASPFYQGN